MIMHVVKSSNIESIGHDPGSNTLRVKFRSGATHEYAGVPARVFNTLGNAPSIGGHYSAHIRGQYPSKKL
jgi:hypothetical protein